ncbi:MAG: hypothetical protein K9G67_08690 [Bacteroidales bacterium]|nr:hypothetical protein [Bacteroidales bacterium]MCF8343310.1 hypothetical protein [Bacteroidales bacterium]MCF8352459.1 hypothetical protein [Bacteroidales bacterium]MCF8376417.1 hypothetical protein [Bacteroidales bacterium]
MSFFRFFFSIVALALIGYFIYIYAKPETKEADNIDQELQMEKDQEIGKTKADDHNDLLKIPEKLSMEQQRMMKDDSIVVIDFKQAGIQLNEERTLIQELFPSAKIEPADASEVFTAYNLWIGQKQYHVISTYTRFGEGFVIDKIYFVTGGFSTRNIHKILAPSEPELN